MVNEKVWISKTLLSIGEEDAPSSLMEHLGHAWEERLRLNTAIDLRGLLRTSQRKWVDVGIQLQVLLLW